MQSYDDSASDPVSAETPPLSFSLAPSLYSLLDPYNNNNVCMIIIISF